MLSDASVRAILRRKIQAVFNPAKTRVVTRLRQGQQAADWKSLLRAVDNTAKVDGWLLWREGIEPVRDNGGNLTARRTYRANYVLWYFRSIEEDGDVTVSSEYDLNAKLDALLELLESDPCWCEEPEVIDAEGCVEHEGLGVINIDTIENKYHYATCGFSICIDSVN